MKRYNQRSAFRWLWVVLTGGIFVMMTTTQADGRETQQDRLMLQSRPTLEQAQSELVKEKTCFGTNIRLSLPSEDHNQNLRDRYTNCTYVEGNLEISWILSRSYDFSFLQHIREVTGYVLINHVNIPQVILPRLQIIRGQTLFKLNKWGGNGFGLLVISSQMNTLELPV